MLSGLLCEVWREVGEGVRCSAREDVASAVSAIRSVAIASVAAIWSVAVCVISSSKVDALAIRSVAVLRELYTSVASSRFLRTASSGLNVVVVKHWRVELDAWQQHRLVQTAEHWHVVGDLDTLVDIQARVQILLATL